MIAGADVGMWEASEVRWVRWGGIQSGSPARARHVLIADDPIMCVAIQLPRTAVLVCTQVRTHPTTRVVFSSTVRSGSIFALH